MEDKNEASHNDNPKLKPPKRTSLATAKQIVYLLVLQMKSKDGSKCKIVFMSVFASLRDANNRTIQLFDSNFQKELDKVDHGVDEDGAFWWIIERKGNVTGDRLEAVAQKVEVIEESDDAARVWRE